MQPSNGFAKIFAAAAALLSLTACHIDGDVLTGGHSRSHSYSEAVSSSCSMLRASANSNLPESTPNCSLPAGSLSAVSLQGSETFVRVWVRKMADGRFPTVGLLTYSDSNYPSSQSHSLTFSCAPAANDHDLPADAMIREYRCDFPQGLPLSSSHLSQSDFTFEFSSVLLGNPGCGAQTAYQMQYIYGDCSHASDPTNGGRGTLVDTVYFPAIYWKS